MLKINIVYINNNNNNKGVQISVFNVFITGIDCTLLLVYTNKIFAEIKIEFFQCVGQHYSRSV